MMCSVTDDRYTGFSVVRLLFGGCKVAFLVVCDDDAINC